MADHGYHRHNSEPSISGANGILNSRDVDRIMVIPNTSDRVCKKQMNICQGTTISGHSTSRSSGQATKAILDKRVQFFGDNMQTSKNDSHHIGDYGDIDQNCRVGSPAVPSILRNAPTSRTATDKNIKLKGKHHSNHQDVEVGKLSCFRFPEMSSHHYNRRVTPVFDHVDITKPSKDVVSPHSPAASFKSTSHRSNHQDVEVGKLSCFRFPEMSSHHYNRRVATVFDQVDITKASKDVVSPHSPAVSFKSTNHHSNHQDVEVGKLSCFRFPEISSHHYNRRVAPVFDHVDITKASNDVVSPHSPAASFKSTSNEDKGKLKIGDDILVHCDARPVKGNDKVFHVTSEHNTGEGLFMSSGSIRGPIAKQKRLVRHGCISSHNIAKAKLFVESSSVSSYAECEDKGRFKIGSDIPVHCDAYPVKENNEAALAAREHNTGEGHSMSSSSIGGPNTAKRKRLVRNGCISPHNIAKAKTFAESSSVSSFVECENVYGGCHNAINGDKVIANESAAPEHNTREGHSMSSSSIGGLNTATRKRLVRNGCISPHNIAKAKTFAESSSVSSYTECDTIYGGSHNAINVDKVIANENAANRSKGKGVLIHPSSSMGFKDRRSDARLNVSSKIVLGKSSSTPSASKLRPMLNDSEVCTPSPSKRQKMFGSSSCTQEETREIICSSSGGKLSAAKSITDHRGCPRRASDSPIGVCDSSPEVREYGPQIDNGNETRAIQIQVDEMMAQELQKQLYNEMLEATSGEQVLQLAREGSMGPASFRGRQRAHVNTGVRSSNTRRSSQLPSLRNRLLRPRIPSSSVTRLRARINRHPSMAASGRSGRLFPSDMDIDMRIELLETLEAVAEDDIRMINQLLQSDQEFGENDYEMLLALDENNHEHLGSSVAQIANLPESTVHSENVDVCSICLETPAIGDTMRHLPCLHKFHKDCIDPWLRRKRSCPNCKSDV